MDTVQEQTVLTQSYSVFLVSLMTRSEKQVSGWSWNIQCQVLHHRRCCPHSHCPHPRPLVWAETCLYLVGRISNINSTSWLGYCMQAAVDHHLTSWKIKKSNWRLADSDKTGSVASAFDKPTSGYPPERSNSKTNNFARGENVCISVL